MSLSHRYTVDQLHRLRASPLVKKPDDLPSIEQWIEPLPEQAQKRLKSQNGSAAGAGRVEEKENTKRLNPFDLKSPMSRVSVNGEDVFLGPKMSFASASAARHQSRRFLPDDPAIMSPSEIPSKQYNDREHNQNSRSKLHQGDSSSRGDIELFGDLRSRHKSRTESQAGEDGGARLRSYFDRERDGDGDRPSIKRNGASKSKLDQPWFRTTSTDITPKEPDSTKPYNGRQGWRQHDRSTSVKQVAERDTSWMQEPDWMAESQQEEPEEQSEHTQADFEKWKERMKSGGSGPPEKKSVHEELPLTSPKLEDQSTADSVFGTWGMPSKIEASDQKSLTGLGGLGTSSLKAAGGKPKMSRFATLFSPPPQPEAIYSPPVAEATPTSIPFALQDSPASPPPREEVRPVVSEDQAGFERMMQMLRMGGSSAQPAAAEPFAGPPLQSSPPMASAADPAISEARVKQSHLPLSPRLPEGYSTEPRVQRRQTPPKHSESFADDRQHMPGSAPPLSPQREQPQQQQQQPIAHLPFPMNMIHQQQRAQFSEQQIYGQHMNQRNSNDMSQLLSAMAGHGHGGSSNPPNLRGPPPGIYGNSQTYENNARRLDTEAPRRELQDDRLPSHMHHPPQPRQSQEDMLRQLQSPTQSAEQQRPYNGPPQWQQGPPPPGFAAMQQRREAHLPPPGFQGIDAPRGPPPPGFFQMQGHAGPQNASSQGMRGQQGPQGPPGGPPQGLPPGFYGQQHPPGFPPNQLPQQVQQQLQQARRQQQPLMAPPPGAYEMYGDAGRRALHGQMHGQMPGYPMQNRGPGAY